MPGDIQSVCLFFVPTNLQQRRLLWLESIDELIAAEFAVHTTVHSEEQTGADRLAFLTHLGWRMCLHAAPPDLMEIDSEDAVPAEHFQLERSPTASCQKCLNTLVPKLARDDRGLTPSGTLVNGKDVELRSAVCLQWLHLSSLCFSVICNLPVSSFSISPPPLT